jgi:nitroimidazol reductase NimA-like FMN-containing flavoprotein (pyridoxamine 5'-phosphate oxidase superfamily)
MALLASDRIIDGWGMTIIDGRTWMEHLSTEGCWELLKIAPVGRVVVTVDGAPEIYPVNFVVDDRSVAFRTAPGSKLRGLERFPVTCFEVDVIDPDVRAGWSVMVKGRAVAVTRVDECSRLASKPLTLWTAGIKDHWIRIRPTEVTGRRIHTIVSRDGDETQEESLS